VLERKCNDLVPFGLTPERAEAIELEELEPYQQRRKNQVEYRETLQNILQLDPIQQAREFEQLIDLEDLLKLSIEDLKAIRLEVLGSETLPEMQTVVQPATPKSKPTAPALQNLREDLGDGISLDLVAIPGGSFLMGAVDGEEGASKDEYPQHQVTIAPFWMGKFTVTQAQWKSISKLKKVKCDLKLDPSNFKGADRPVEQVSWGEAIGFCDRLSAKTGKRYGLPSEAQWEYACRAGTTTPFHFGDTISTDVANYDGKYTYGEGKKGVYRKETTVVGSFSPNTFGLYDMHGNVWEWCADPWHDSYKDAPIDGSIWKKNPSNDSYRMLRGGSWNFNPTGCRSANRHRFDRVYRNLNVGFRIILSFSPQDS
jgi:formylglycine-generating enzyme required for sulfatase activity